jgi:AcrR family transcriptional regulator
VTTTAPRRELLLDAAAELFAARGFYAVGIDDIGAAAGISGPGVYRHFSSKQDLLTVLCDRTMDRMLGLAEAAQGLDELLDLQVTFAVEERALLSVWVRERRALAEDVRRSLRHRQQRYEQIWRQALAPLRPDLSPPEIAFVVSAALALLNTSSLIESPLPAPSRKDLLASVARAGLTGDPRP